MRVVRFNFSPIAKSERPGQRAGLGRHRGQPGFVQIRNRNPARAFRLETTRGDRLFMTHLGTAFIFLAWLAFMGAPLWGALGLSLVWAIVVFRWA